MAVDTAEIKTVYEALSENMLDTLDTLFEAHSISAEGKASIIAQSITTLLQVSAQLVADEAIKTKQSELIDAQIDTEVEKKALTTRQKEAYNDNLRIKEGELLSNVVGMYGAGGTTLPSGLETTMLNAINAITP